MLFPSAEAKAWENTKAKAVKVITGMAHDLIRLYAERKIIKGFAFSRPDDTYAGFESLFPFEETIDQRRAVEDVFSDMESENRLPPRHDNPVPAPRLSARPSLFSRESRRRTPSAQ